MNQDKLDAAIMFMCLLSVAMIALVYFPHLLGVYYEQ